MSSSASGRLGVESADIDPDNRASTAGADADLHLDGSVVLVSGGGQGLGRAYASELARHGARVVVNDLPPGDTGGTDAAAEVVAEITAGGGTAVAAHGDVSTRQGARSVVASALNAFGGLHAVINNAGIMRNGLFEDITEDMFGEVLAVNLAGPFWLTQAAWPSLRECHQGRVVMISSAGGMFSRDGLANYAASKAGVYGLTKALAFEGAPYSIAVNAVLPKGRHMVSVNVPPPTMGARDDRDVRTRLAHRRRNEAVAPLVAYLASPACTVNGHAFAAGYGHFGRVFVGMCDGWSPRDVDAVTPPMLMGHMKEIEDLARFSVPSDSYDEYDILVRLLASTGSGE